MIINSNNYNNEFLSLIFMTKYMTNTPTTFYLHIYICTNFNVKLTHQIILFINNFINEIIYTKSYIDVYLIHIIILYYITYIKILSNTIK